MSIDDAGEQSPTMPASRLAAELSKSPDVRRVKQQFEYRLCVKITNSGLGVSDLKLIRSYGWHIAGFTPRHNSVSVVRNDRYTTAPGGYSR